MSIAKVSNGVAPVPTNSEDLATACVICSHNCGMRMDVVDNTITDIRPDPSNPVSDGYSCNKAQAIYNYVQHDQRVTQPLKKQPDGSFEPISWDVAIGEIAGRLKTIREDHTPRAIAVAGLGGQGNHANGLGILPFLGLTGSPMLFNALGQEKTQHALVDRRLFKARHDAYLAPDEHNSDYVIVMGSNPLVSNRGSKASDSFKALVRDENRQLVVVDPRVTETSRKANRHLQIAPCSDLFLLVGMAGVMVQEGLINEKKVKQKVDGLQDMQALFADIDVAEMAKRCDISEDNLRATAREFATAPTACIAYDLGIEQVPNSTLISYMIRVVLLLTDNIGKKGAELFIRQFGPVFPYLKDMPKLLESGIEGIPMFSPAPQFPPSKIPEEILSEHPDRIRALIVDGANPLVSYSDTHIFREAFEKLDLLVVIEPAMTESAKVADYVLPTPTGYEKWEFSGFPRYDLASQWRPPVVNGPADALPEPEIYFRLARAMNLVSAAPKNLHKLAEHALKPIGAAAYFAALTSQAATRGGNQDKILGRILFWAYETLGPKMADPTLGGLWFLGTAMGLTRRKEILRANPQWKSVLNPFKLSSLLVEQMLANPNGFKAGEYDPNNNFADFCHTKNGKAKIYQPDFVGDIKAALANDPESGTEDYPFLLNGGMRTGWSANTIVRDPSWRKGKGPHYALHISVDDAAAMSLSKDDRVRLESCRGGFEVPIKIDKNTRPGHLNIPNIFNLQYPDPETGELINTGVNINELTDMQDCDPYTGCPNTKRVRCRVTKVEQVAETQAA